jgi:hypothetical protein
MLTQTGGEAHDRSARVALAEAAVVDRSAEELALALSREEGLRLAHP